VVKIFVWIGNEIKRHNKGGDCKYNNGLLGIMIIKQIKEKFVRGYLNSQVSISVNSEITLHSTAFKIYKTLTDKKTLLSVYFTLFKCLNKINKIGNFIGKITYF